MNTLSGEGVEVCVTNKCTAQTWGDGYDWAEDFLYENYQATTRWLIN